MSLFFKRPSQRLDGPSPGLSGALSEMSCNSPGKIRVLKSRKATRSSPYGAKRGSRLLSNLSTGFEDDSCALLSPGRSACDSFVADKHVGIKISDDLPKHGLKLETVPNHGVIVCGIDRKGQAAKNGMLVGDVIMAVDAIPVTSHVALLQILDTAAEGRRLTLTASGSTRSLSLDKTKGDLGMTCSASLHSSRGVMLKRIQKGSLADAAALYCGDTIISVNETLVHTHEQAVQVMNAAHPEVRLVIWGKSTEATLPNNGAPLGITLCNHENPSDGPGVKVLRVEHQHRAAQAGISAGDAIMSINGVLCTDHVQAIGMLQNKEAAEFTVVFMNKYSH